MYVGIVADHNIKAEPAQDARGQAYPRHWVFVRKLWEATQNNPDPVTAHPIPVFLNSQFKDGNFTWEPLPVGTRVLITKVNDVSKLNREQWAVIGYAPMTDALYPDHRETVHYTMRKGGNTDKWVLAPGDPVAGPNEDYGRTHRDGDGMGWHSRRPYDADPVRREAEFSIPGASIKFNHKTDESTNYIEIEVAGPVVTYTAKLDGVNGIANLVDDQGNSVTLDSLAASMTTVVMGDINFTASAGGNMNITATGDVVVTATGSASVTAATAANVTAGTTANITAPAVNLGGAGGARVARVGDTVNLSTGIITGGSLIVRAA